jgi:hypothetical protein
MKVDLRKLSKDSRDFAIEYKEGENFAHFSGCFFLRPPFLVVDGKINGKIEVVCDVSGDKFFDELNEEVKIKVVEGLHNGFDEVYDIVESNGNIFDFESFLIDEIESFKNDYHKKQELSTEEFIIENI